MSYFPNVIYAQISIKYLLNLFAKFGHIESQKKTVLTSFKNESVYCNPK